MALPRVTVIVTQREQFTLSVSALDNLLADQSYPFDLIYVDGNSPAEVYEALQERTRQHPFMQLIRRDHFLPSNEARNLALTYLKQPTDYVVIKDNTVFVEPGWLKALVECAEEEGVAVVSPLIMQGDPWAEDKEIHFMASKLEVTSHPGGRIGLTQVAVEHGTALSQLHYEPKRGPVTILEPHCILLRTSLLDSFQFEPFMDDLTTHIDLTLQVSKLNQQIFVEPQARVTYPDLTKVWRLTWQDLQFYRFAWQEKTINEALKRLKTNLKTTEDYDFWLRLSLAGCRMHFLPQRLAYYRLHQHNISQDQTVVLENHLKTRASIAQHFPQQVASATQAIFNHLGQLLEAKTAWAAHVVKDNEALQAAISHQQEREARAWQDIAYLQDRETQALQDNSKLKVTLNNLEAALNSLEEGRLTQNAYILSLRKLRPGCKRLISNWRRTARLKKAILLAYKSSLPARTSTSAF